jgi:uncharacterized protein YkwD
LLATMPEEPLAASLAATVTPSPEPVEEPQQPAITSEQALALAHVYLDMQRQIAGLGVLERDDGLDGIAQRHADDLAVSGRFSHIGSGGDTLADRLARGGTGDGWAGENLGRSSEASADAIRAIVAGFMNSEAHRANVLGPRFVAIGLGLAFARSDGSAIFVVVFTD